MNLKLRLCMICIVFLSNFFLCYAENVSDRIIIEDFDKFRYERILEREGCKFNFFDTKDTALEYAKFLFKMDKYTDKSKEYSFSAYDAGVNWMIYISEKVSPVPASNEIIDSLDGKNEYIFIFKKGKGEILRLEIY